MADQVEQLVQSAVRLVQAGKWDEAERVWQDVQRLQPLHPQALFSLGVHALRRGQQERALELLTAAREVAPRDLMALMALAALWRQRGDAVAERQAVEDALAIDPYFIPALLAKGDWLERNGNPAAAATVYRNAVKISPPEAQWPAEYRAHLLHAREVTEQRSAALQQHLEQRTGKAQAELHPLLAERWREAIAVTSGRSKPYHSNSNQLLVPRLPAIPFFDRSVCPELKAFEARTDVIRGELVALLETERKRFQPYVELQPGQPVDQWQELNRSLRWSVFHLYKSGVPQQENLERCPETAKALAALPLATIDGLCPNVMFSALAPHTHIPPHHGETNARVIAHLPLIVPEGCTYRVGFEHRKWKVGETLIFDDSLEHEARNDSDQLRVVLIFDLWNPILTPAERVLVNQMVVAAREFGTVPG
ncbi:MAG: aspartyl/asparaginyl beta-hydroxylase domain-containing protein [Gammaproteobacteria bacterium]